MCEKLLLNADEMAQALGISLRKLENLIASNEAPTYIRIGRIRKWRVSEVNTWIDQKYGQSAQTPQSN